MSLFVRRKILLSLVLAGVGLLAACNGSEDFSNANLSSPVLGGDGDPADPDGEAVEVELVAGREGSSGAKSAVISNLGYSCGGTTGYIPKDGNVEGFIPFRARCPLSARKIQFFIGPTDSADAIDRIRIGEALLPQVSGRALQFGPGRYQFSLADLIDAPGRQPGSDKNVYLRAALIAALDSAPATDHVIEIPDGAHTVAAQQPGTTPDQQFDYADYSAFTSAWQPWLDAVEIETGLTLNFPASDTDAQNYATAGSNQIRSGSWLLDHNASVPYFSRIDDPDGNYDNMLLQMSLLVMPDGLVRGIGLLSRIDTSGPPTPDDQDVVTLAQVDESLDEGQFLGGGPGSAVEVEGVLELGNALDVAGRFFSNAGYDGLVIGSGDSAAVDFEVDFPDLELSELADNEKLTLEGTVFGSGQASVGLKAGRDGVVGTSLLQAVMDQLPDFYQVTLKVACWEDSVPVSCTTVPAEELGINYPVNLAADDRPQYPVETEKPRGANNGQVRVQILDNGLIVTDRDGDCSDVDGSLMDGAGGDGVIQEYQVGFVSFTETERNSANLVLLMAGPNAWEDAGTMPQYGTRISGRIDLDDPQMRLYRTLDENFDSKIRAVWFDQYYSPFRLLKVYSEPRSDEQNREIVASQQGAIEGRAIDYDLDTMSGTCPPLGS